MEITTPSFIAQMMFGAIIAGSVVLVLACGLRGRDCAPFSGTFGKEGSPLVVPGRLPTEDRCWVFFFG